MSTSARDQWPFHPRPQTRVLLALIGLLLLTLGATLVILNALGIVPLPGVWSNALGVAFAALGVIIAFGQWLLPVSPPSLAGTSPDDRTRQPLVDAAADRDRKALHQQVEGALDRRLRKGALIVLTSDRQVAHEIKVISQLAWMRSPNACDQLSETHKETVRRYRVGTGYVCAAIYRNLDPDDYMVWSDVNHPTSVPVFSNEATVVDWR